MAAIEEADKENVSSNLVTPGWTRPNSLKTPLKIASAKKFRSIKRSITKSFLRSTPLSNRKMKNLRKEVELINSTKSQRNRVIKSEITVEPLHELLSNFDIQKYQDIAVSYNVYGSEKEEMTKKHLKRARPKKRVVLAGYTKEYIDSETKRLANGYREFVSKSDEFVKGIFEVEQKQFELIEHLRQTIENAKTTNDVIQKRLSKSQSQLSTESNSRVKLEKEVETLKENLENQKKVLMKSLEKEKQLLSQCGELTLAKTNLERSSKAEKEALETKHNETVAELKLNIRNTEILLDNTKNEVTLRENCMIQLKEERSALKQETKSLEAKIESLNTEKSYIEKQNKGLEEKLSSRDTHLEKTLETFQQTQQFSQVRVEELTKEKHNLETTVNELKKSLEELRETTTVEGKAQLEKIKTLEEERVKANEEHETCKETLFDEKTELEVTLKKLTGQYESEKGGWKKEMKSLKAKVESFETVNEELTSEKSQLESELQAMKETYESEKRNTELEQLYEVNKEKEILKKKVIDFENLKEKLIELSDRLFKSDRQNRELRNEIHTLKGTVRVIARVKPSRKCLETSFCEVNEEEDLDLTEHDKLKRECEEIVNKLDKSMTDLTNLELGIDEKSIALSLESEAVRGVYSKDHYFNFNHVFGPLSSQEQIFDEVSTFVQSALDGYNVCLFSYGQTGSGKTYTMTGDPFSSVNSGIIPRSTRHVLSYKQKLEELGWSFKLEVTILEIYNEHLLDLLSNKQQKLEIINSTKEMEVKNCSKMVINTVDDVQHLLLRAENKRKVEKTDMNSQSSRSHTVFTMFITGTHQQKKAKLKGSLSLCDLAGSERLKRSKVKDERLKETQNINKSLSALSDIFVAIKKRNKHIPYRNSVLTKLLKPCFDGQGKVLMIVNISSEKTDLQESLCSLRFAQHVNQTKVGRAKKNVQQINKDNVN